MTDFLKSHPNVTKDEYMWEWSIPQITLSSIDFSHIVHPDRRKRKGKRKGRRIIKQKTYNGPTDFVKDLNLPTIDKLK